jgi:threonine dehydrogenase-like Zn-dependent dehydrogenase
MKTKTAFLTAPGKFELGEAELFPKGDQLLVKVAACGLCNWELNHWKGILGTCPQTLGHEWAGTVVETGKEVKSIKTGEMVTILPDSLSGFSEYALVSEKNCCRLDAKVNPVYALGEPLKCVTTVLRAAAPEAGDHAVVQGCGPMGLWCIQALAGNLLSSLIALDIDDTKLEYAKKFGATHTINSKTEDAAKRIEEITEGHLADFVIEGTGVPALLNSAQRYLRRTGRGRLLLMSSHESICKEFDFREAIGRGSRIISPHPAYSADQADDLRRAVSLMNRGVFRVEEVVSHVFSLDDIQTAFETLENKPAGYMKGIVVP